MTFTSATHKVSRFEDANFTASTKPNFQNSQELLFSSKVIKKKASSVMSTPIDQVQQPPPLIPNQPPPPPPMAVIQEAYRANTGHGSVGPVIAVLAVISILGVIAGMIGRLCSGRTIMGHGHFDFEGWLETKCSSCIDGRVDPPPPLARPVADVAARSSCCSSSSSAEEAVAAEPEGAGISEVKEEVVKEEKVVKNVQGNISEASSSRRVDNS